MARARIVPPPRRPGFLWKIKRLKADQKNREGSRNRVDTGKVGAYKAAPTTDPSGSDGTPELPACSLTISSGWKGYVGGAFVLSCASTEGRFDAGISLSSLFATNLDRTEARLAKA